MDDEWESVFGSEEAPVGGTPHGVAGQVLFDPTDFPLDDYPVPFQNLVQCKPPRTAARLVALVESFDGQIQRTANAIGVHRDYVANWLRHPAVIEAIRERHPEHSLEHQIAGRLERQAFWSATMWDETADMSNRLRASELLGRSEADFTDKQLSEVTHSVADFLRQLEHREPAVHEE